VRPSHDIETDVEYESVDAFHGTATFASIDTSSV